MVKTGLLSQTCFFIQSFFRWFSVSYVFFQKKNFCRLIIFPIFAL